MGILGYIDFRGSLVVSFVSVWVTSPLLFGLYFCFGVLIVASAVVCCERVLFHGCFCFVAWVTSPLLRGSFVLLLFGSSLLFCLFILSLLHMGNKV